METLKPLTQTQLAKRFELVNSAPISLKIKVFKAKKISHSELESYMREHDPDNLMWVEDSIKGKKKFYKPVV